MADFEEIMKLQPWLKPGHKINGVIQIAVEIILTGRNLRI
jgi:hypothetical protein